MTKPMTEAAYNVRWIERMKAKCVIDSATGCWLWQKLKTYNGYAQDSYRTRTGPVHRRMYEVVRGVKLERFQYACHTCDTRHCINPDHIWIGSPQDNQVDMSRKKRAAGQLQTHCHLGHEFTEENTYWSNRGRTKARNCRTCHRARFRIRAGWPKDLAYSLTAVPHGYAPVGASWKR